MPAITIERAADAAGPIARRIADVARGVAAVDARDLAGRLTLLLLVLYGGEYWDLNIPVIVFAALGLIAPAVQLRAWYWLVLTAVIVNASVPRFYLLDNHKILMVYWTLALALARDSALLAHSARLLVGCAFAFATAWKIATPDFLDGSFLHFTMGVDGRFAGFARLVGHAAPEALAANQDAVRSILAGDTSSIELMASPAMRPIAIAMAWWTVFIEGTVAVAFLAAPWSRAMRWVRDPALLVFLLSTYSIATVIGFGWILCIMGFAQTGSDQRRARLAYLVTFLILQVYRAPWSQLAPAVEVGGAP